jgi:hypothetical protein
MRSDNLAVPHTAGVLRVAVFPQNWNGPTQYHPQLTSIDASLELSDDIVTVSLCPDDGTANHEVGYGIEFDLTLAAAIAHRDQLTALIERRSA